MQRIAHSLVLVVSLVGCAGEQDDLAGDEPPAVTQPYAVLAMNRRGMSFPDNDFSVSAIFPPANFLVAQVVKTSDDPATMPELLVQNSSGFERTAPLLVVRGRGLPSCPRLRGYFTLAGFFLS